MFHQRERTPGCLQTSHESDMESEPRYLVTQEVRPTRRLDVISCEEGISSCAHCPCVRRAFVKRGGQTQGLRRRPREHLLGEIPEGIQPGVAARTVVGEGKASMK